MPGIYYSVGPTVNAQIDASSRQNFLNNLRDALLDCRWEIIESVNGDDGTTGYKMESFPTPSLTVMRVTFRWAFGNIQFRFSDALELYVTNENARITISSSKIVRAICGPHQCFLLSETHTDGHPNLNAVSFGVPVLSTPYLGGAFWATFDVLANLILFGSFRQNLAPPRSINYAFLLNGIFKDALDNSTVINPQLLSMRGSQLLNPVPFYLGSYPVILPKIAMGLIDNSYANVVPIWDSFVYCNTINTKMTIIGDGRRFESYTLGADCGSLFLLTEDLSASRRGFSY